jgi:predicted phage terminase large subunit-like protein
MTHDEALATIKEFAARRAIASLSEFVRQGWHIIEPGTKLIWNWHLDIICDALQRQSEGDAEYRRLLINVPPGTMKSLLVSVFQPAWQWLIEPSRRKLFVARDDELVVRDSRKTRDLITSEWYQGLIKTAHARRGTPTWELRHDQASVVNFANTNGGVRQCQSLGSALQGKRGNDVVIDDPVDAKSILLGSSESIRNRMDEVSTIIDKSLANRVNSIAEARWTMIMQRLHEDDPAGRIIKRGGWKVIQIQMEFDPFNERNHPDDPRADPKELMFPSFFPRHALDELLERMTLRHFDAQYNQSPTSETGGYVLRTYFEGDMQYDKEPAVNVYMASDYATKEPGGDKEPDYTEHGVFGLSADRHIYVLDWWYGQTKSDEWVERLLDLIEQWKPMAYFGEAGVIWNSVEPLATMRQRERNIWMRTEMLPSIADKASRGRSFQGMASMKRVHFRKNTPWAQRVIEQCVGFPGSTFDDAFDTMSLMCRAVAMAHPAILAKTEERKPMDYNRRRTRNVGSGWKTA